jgi:hypothetical protein
LLIRPPANTLQVFQIIQHFVMRTSRREDEEGGHG